MNSNLPTPAGPLSRTA